MGKVPALSLENRWCIWAGVPLGCVLASAIFLGTTAAAFFIVQGFLGFSFLELVNYVEHYGLERETLPNGKHAKVGAEHCWNADWFFSNAILFQLQRHSDHHMHAIRPGYALRSFPDAPQLPASYPAMIMLCTIPPLWFRIMDPILDKYTKQVDNFTVVNQTQPYEVS